MTLQRESRRSLWLYPLVMSLVVSVVVVLLILVADVPLSRIPEVIRTLGQGSSLSNAPQVAAAVLGIAITVVAIIVELAANRYTPRIADLFFREPVNYLMMGFYVLVSIESTWAAAVQGTGASVPAGSFITQVLITLSFVSLLPYFAYVFAFLNPSDVVRRISDKILSSIGRSAGGSDGQAARVKAHAIEGVEQIADVALNAIEKKDKGISIACLAAMGNLTRSYLAEKGALPASWFAMDSAVLRNADFVSLGTGVAADIERRRTWFEIKVFRQFQMIYNEALNRLRDLDYVVAIETRLVAEEALKRNDMELLRSSFKFLNTFMRATINAKDVRTAYNLLNQYRLLIETVLRAGEVETACDAALRVRDYGQLAFGNGLPFVLETAAYDLCSVNELAYDLTSPAQARLLDIFLTVDKEAGVGGEHEASLRGVRKAQIKLAAYYLLHGEKELARRIFDDMAGEVPERLASIRDELLHIEDREFWEVTDRGTNFDYLEPERKKILGEFFNWFGDTLPPPASGRENRSARPGKPT